MRRERPEPARGLCLPLAAGWDSRAGLLLPTASPKSLFLSHKRWTFPGIAASSAGRMQQLQGSGFLSSARGAKNSAKPNPPPSHPNKTNQRNIVDKTWNYLGFEFSVRRWEIVEGFSPALPWAVLRYFGIFIFPLSRLYHRKDFFGLFWEVWELRFSFPSKL